MVDLANETEVWLAAKLAKQANTSLTEAPVLKVGLVLRCAPWQFPLAPRCTEGKPRPVPGPLVHLTLFTSPSSPDRCGCVDELASFENQQARSRDCVPVQEAEAEEAEDNQGTEDHCERDRCRHGECQLVRCQRDGWRR